MSNCTNQTTDLQKLEQQLISLGVYFKQQLRDTLTLEEIKLLFQTFNYENRNDHTNIIVAKLDLYSAVLEEYNKYFVIKDMKELKTFIRIIANLSDSIKKYDNQDFVINYVIKSHGGKKQYLHLFLRLKYKESTNQTGVNLYTVQTYSLIKRRK